MLNGNLATTCLYRMTGNSSAVGKATVVLDTQMPKEALWNPGRSL